MTRLVEHVDRQVTVGLQVLHGLLACTQCRDLCLESFDFLDLSLQDLDFGTQQIVLVLLALDHHLEVPVDQRGDQQAAQRGQHHIDLERLFAALLGCLAVR